MAVDNPPAYLQAGSYSASRDRLHLVSARYLPTTLNLLDCAARGGILGGQSSRQASFSMTGWDVTVGRFVSVIENTFASQPGDYQAINPASQVLTVAASSPTTNRIDIIGVRIQDAFYSGALNQGDLVVVQGTPTAGVPADPTLPASFLPIVRVTVNAATSTGILTDLRKRTATMGSVYSPFAGQLADVGTMAGEIQLMPAASPYPPRLRTWDGSAWRGASPFSFDKPSQVGSGTLPAGGTGAVIMSVSVADPGYAYKLVCSGSLSWGMVGATLPGNHMQATVTLDSTTYNVGVITGGIVPSASLGAAFSQANVVATSVSTASLTGAHTIRLISRNSGGADMTIPLNPADGGTSMSVHLVPA